MAKVGVFVSTADSDIYTLICEAETQELGLVIQSLNAYGVWENGKHYGTVEDSSYLVGDYDVYFAIDMIEDETITD